MCPWQHPFRVPSVNAIHNMSIKRVDSTHSWRAISSSGLRRCYSRKSADHVGLAARWLMHRREEALPGPGRRSSRWLMHRHRREEALPRPGRRSYRKARHRRLPIAGLPNGGCLWQGHAAPPRPCWGHARAAGCCCQGRETLVRDLPRLAGRRPCSRRSACRCNPVWQLQAAHPDLSNLTAAAEQAHARVAVAGII